MTTNPRKRSGPVWLVGMMGAGKSTIGPVLAHRLGRRFLDADAEIEREAGTSVAQIFERFGEAEFRDLEARFIEAVEEDAVVALGGGAIAQPGMAEKLARRGTVVYLKARPRSVLARIGRAESRPLLAGLSPDERLKRLEELLEGRRAAYETAHITVGVDALRPKAIADEIVEALEAIELRSEEGA